MRLSKRLLPSSGARAPVKLRSNRPWLGRDPLRPRGFEAFHGRGNKRVILGRPMYRPQGWPGKDGGGMQASSKQADTTHLYLFCLVPFCVEENE